MTEQPQYEIDNFENLRVLGSPEKNLAACIIASAITALYTIRLKAHNKQSHREREKIKARWFFEERPTSRLNDCCDALGWNKDRVKRAANNPEVVEAIASYCVIR